MAVLRVLFSVIVLCVLCYLVSLDTEGFAVEACRKLSLIFLCYVAIGNRVSEVFS